MSLILFLVAEIKKSFVAEEEKKRKIETRNSSGKDFKFLFHSVLFHSSLS